VEVYRQEAGGWFGIRPPSGSFSLVSAKELAARNGDIGEAKQDDVSSRIGSQLSDKRNAVQVRLKKGEAVEILGRESIDGETWFKIAPPAGEFRWIHAACVERGGTISDAVTPIEGDAKVVPTGATSQGAVSTAEKNSKSSNTPPPPIPAQSSDESWRASSNPAAAATANRTPSPEVTPPPLATIAPSADATAAPQSVPEPPSNPGSATAVASSPAAYDLPRHLTDIEMRLSRMAAAPPQLWNTERLQRDAEQLLAQAKTGAERDAVKVTLGKIDQFTALTRRYQQGGKAVSRQPSAVSQELANSQQPTADSRYDAVGILRPVVSKRPGAPQFALVDERGQVVTFVTPTPDVNLQPYLGRRVGIAGNRGFIPEFNRAHVTAGRVTPLVR
jgi:hypothetical protein